MDTSNVQMNNDRLELAYIAQANIRDYLNGRVEYYEYHQRRLLCQSLEASLPCQTQAQMMPESQTLATNSQTDDADLTSVKSRLLRKWSDETMSSASFDSAYNSSTPSPPPINDTSRVINVRDDANDFSKRRTRNKPTIYRPNNNTIGPKRAAADIDEPDPTSPKKKRNRGPKPRVMYGGNGPIQLWQLILQLLVSPPSSELESALVEWTREEKYGFRIVQPNKLAQLWGERKKKPAMNFEKLSRGLRYYYGKSMLEKIHGKENTYQFVWDISEIIGYDPVDGYPVSDLMNGFPASDLKNGFPVSDPKNEFPVSHLKNGLPVSERKNGCPVSHLKNGFPVYELKDGSSVSDLKNGFPVSNPVYGLPVIEPVYSCGMAFSDPLYGMPVSDSVYDIPVSDPVFVPVSNRVGGYPVSQSVGGLPGSDFISHQVVPIAPLDFTMLVESDQKSSFYEAL